MLFENVHRVFHPAAKQTEHNHRHIYIFQHLRLPLKCLSIQAFDVKLHKNITLLSQLTLTKAKATKGGSSASRAWDSPSGIVPTALIFPLEKQLCRRLEIWSVL